MVGSAAVLRLLPALAAAAIVVLAALLARALGGGRGAQLLAATCVLASPLYLRTGVLLQPVVFDQLWWTLALYALVRLGRGPGEPGAPGDWLLLGLALGLGLLTKFSVAFIAVGVLADVLATPLRNALRTRWPWVAALCTAVIGAPSVVGQVRLGWPVVRQMADLRASQLVHVGPLAFVAGQVLWGPAVLLAILGAWALLAPPAPAALRAGRAAGVACAGAARGRGGARRALRPRGAAARDSRGAAGPDGAVRGGVRGRHGNQHGRAPCAAAGLRRHARLAGAGGSRCAGLPRPARRRPGAGRGPRRQLRRGRGDRGVRAGARVAGADQPRRALRPWVVPEQRNTWVFVCDGARRTLQQVWPSLAGRN